MRPASLAAALASALAFVVLTVAPARPARSAPAADEPAAPPAAPPNALANASFEEWGPKGPAGWETFEGARDGDTGQASELAPDREFTRDGATSLRLSGGAGTTSWQLIRQKAPAEAGQRVTLRFAGKCVNVRREGKQYANANAIVEFVDAKGERIQLLWSEQFAGTRDWRDLTITAFAPAGTKAVWAGFFLSQSGTMWVDGARLEIASADVATPAGREVAFTAAADHLRATYPFFGHAGRPSADDFLAKGRERCLAAKDEDGFVDALRVWLSALDDPHIWLRRNGNPIGTARSPAPRPNLNPEALKSALGTPIEGTAPFVAARIGDGDQAVGYVAIPTWRLDDAQVARLDAILDGFADCRGLVIDVRANAGGDEMRAQRVASRFAKEEIVYARSRYRDPADAGGALFPPSDRKLPARTGAAADARPVAVLQGPWCMSSCEGFLLMARALPTVTTVGTPSRGASGNPKAVTVLPDLEIWSSTWRTYLPGGGEGDGADTIERRGVPPEVEVKWTVGARDPVLAAALEIVRK